MVNIPLESPFSVGQNGVMLCVNGIPDSSYFRREQPLPSDVCSPDSRLHGQISANSGDISMNVTAQNDGLDMSFVRVFSIVKSAEKLSVTVCGVSADSMKWSYDARCNSVPTILLLMQDKLYALGGLKAEGIFRINPENSEEGQVRKHLNKGIVPDEIDVHCLAGLIKAWFRELPSGVLDGLSPKQVLHCDAEEDCVELIEQLRPTESCLLGWAVDLMADVVEHEESNKMSARNIAMGFAPNMTKMSDPLTALLHAVQVTNLLQTLITRRIRERGEAEAEAAAGYSPVSPRVSDRHECETAGPASDDEDLPPYSPISEDKYESDSLSEIEYCFSRQLDVHDNAKDDFLKQLERIILCRDQSSPITGSTLHPDSSVSFFDSSTSDDDDEGSRSSSVGKNSRSYLQ